jgi:hypothetical protein
VLLEGDGRGGASKRPPPTAAAAREGNKGGDTLEATDEEHLHAGAHFLQVVFLRCVGTVEEWACYHGKEESGREE